MLSDLGLLDGLGLRILSLADLRSAIDVDESGKTLAENAERKAVQQAAHARRWVLGDDSGLLVDALGGAPGVISARYAGPGATAAANREKLLAELAKVAERAALGALPVPSGAGRSDRRGACRSERRCQGRILTAPRGR